jgi:hypothetical protein
VLCPTCRRKLATILEPVVAAAGDSEVADGVGGDAATLPSAADDEDLTGMLDESGMEPRPDPMELSDASEVDDDSESGQPDRDGPPSDRDRPAGDSGSRTGANGDGTATDGDRAVEATDTDGSQPTEGEGAPTGTASDDTSDDQSDDAGTNGQGLTRLEYNKVMRLLQNRELPVERADIQAVAVNAYEIEPAEFDTIVDAAIDRGLIGERDGQLVAPE